ncbi:ABC transporter ATP-binding protein [Rothia sp. ZJ1223]|uniref:ABC transporter ATP-binding protein n=1 Tax=Rothia sp. ZJ1223 TaxID=2811098 RepID=UPI00195CAAB6|nr:ABC transporter ATP-binding protein [Rothia sp. ZJ1223]MBM7052010.1 ABC transporter ATP-binding protein [Rothia sp. ZJ1223]
MEHPSILAQGISKSFTESESSQTVLSEVSLTFYPHRVYAVCGPSGSGKSTLLSVISAQEKPDSGSVEILGQPLNYSDAKAATSFRCHHIGFIFQDFRLLEAESVYANVELPLLASTEKLTRAERKQRVEQALESARFSLKSSRKVKMLSGGEKQRVTIARALVNDPEIIIADEPTSALDAQLRQEIMKLFRTLAEAGKTVVLATHDEEVMHLCDEVIRLH